MRRVPFALLSAIGMAAPAFADIHYVADPRVHPQVNPAYPYTSAETASFSVAEAIDAADLGDTVLVLPGTYGSQDELYWLKNGVDLMGSGSDRAEVLAELSVRAGSMVTGFRFTNTRVKMGPLARMNDCLFDGARIEVYSTPNSSGEQAAIIRRCTFVGSTQSPTTNSRVLGGDAVLLDCDFQLGGWGAGVGAGSAERFEIIGCTFRGCTKAVRWGGGGTGMTVSNCLFVDNLYAVWMNGQPVGIENCTFYGNEHAVWVASECEPGPHINSSILWASTSADIVVDRTDGYGIPVVTFSNIESGWQGSGNISTDPLFNPDHIPHGDFKITSLSPCVDAGDPFSDWTREPEPNGGRVNMGWHGNTWQANTSEKVDTDGDNIRDDWEMKHFANLEGDMWRDADGDGLSDREECWYLTDPNNPDSDGDTLPDGREVIDLGTNPLTPDTDNDGTPDAKEVAQGTDPLDWTDAFTVLHFRIEEGYLYITYPTIPGYEYSLYSSNWPNGPFGFTVSPYRGRYGVLTHTDVLRLGPYNRFFRIKARRYP